MRKVLGITRVSLWVINQTRVRNLQYTLRFIYYKVRSTIDLTVKEVL